MKGVGKSPRRPRAATWGALVLALLFLVQGLLGNTKKSLTWDEPVFIGGGYSILVQGDLEQATVTWATPPLLQQLHGLALLFMDLDAPGPEELVSQHPVSFGRELVFRGGGDVRSIAFWARLPGLLIGAGLVFSIYAWGRRFCGDLPALGAAAIASCSPNLLAHAKLATSDLGCAAAMFVAVWTMWRALQSKQIRDWVICGVVTGLALLTKFTALLLGPIYAVLALASLRRTDSGLTFRGLHRQGAIVLAVAALVVGAGYNFTFDYSYFLRGASTIYDVHLEDYRYYLLGETSEEGWWYYHLVAFALKVPIPILLLLGLAAWSSFRSNTGRELALFALVPAAFVIVVSFFDPVNLGLRRILPAFPFLFLFTAQAFVSSARWIRFSGVGLIAWTAGVALWIHPHHLAYFNALAGGPDRGPYLLEDSNIDWGQDLPALAKWQEGRPADEVVRLNYFGSADPGAYGVRAVPLAPTDPADPRPGVYAMSVHTLVRLRKSDEPVDWLTLYEPIARAGYSIYIYQFP